MFQAISAKVGPNNDIPCCEWVGERGAGHYVKMVHNGIEYGDMQLICEAYQLLHELGGLNNDELYDVFETWNQGDLQSYLIEITRDIFSVKDDQGGDDYLVDKILDVAGAKGTGKWMSQLALDLGVPSTLVTTAVFARGLSAQKEARVRASEKLNGPSASSNPKMTAIAKELIGDRDAFVEAVRQALYASKIVSYAQGFVQLQAAAAEHDWNLDYGQCALLWRGGCIIRAQFFDRIKEAFDKDANLENLLLTPFFEQAVENAQESWRAVVAAASMLGIPGAGIQHGIVLLRRLPTGTLACEPVASPTRLLRRPHLPASGQRRNISHRMDPTAQRACCDLGRPVPRSTQECVCCRFRSLPFVSRCTMNRGQRQFLKSTGSASSILAAAAVVRPLWADESRDKLNLGIIGCGGIMNHHLRGLARRGDNVSIAWLCDVDPTQIERISKNIGRSDPRRTARYEDVIEDGYVDAVIIATPHHWHAPIAIAAMQAGKDVYIEKPISHVYSEGHAIIQAAKKYQRVVQQGSQMRSSPVTDKAAKLLADGIIGDIKVARAWTAETRDVVKPVPDTDPPTGVDYDRWLGPAPARPFNEHRFHVTWRMFRDYGNGEIGDDGIHDIDMAAWGLGIDSCPKQITARGSRMSLHGHASEYPDNMNVTWEFPDGRLMVYENYPFTAYGMHGFDNGNVFYGTKGYMIFSRRGAFSIFLGPKSKPGPTEGRCSRADRLRRTHDRVSKRRPNQKSANESQR